VASTTAATGGSQQPAVTRRRFFRRSKAFQGVYYAATGEHVPVVGLNASGGGFCVIFQEKFDHAPAEIRLGAVVDSEPFTMNAMIRWADVMKIKGVEHYRYGVKLTAIADRAWDRLMRWTVEDNPEFVEGATLSAAQRDALITPKTQERITGDLLRKGRIDPYEGNNLPLVEYNFIRYTMRHSTPYVWLAVRSRTTDPILHTSRDLTSNVLVGCYDGHVKFLD